MSFPWLEPNQNYKHLVVGNLGYIEGGLRMAQEQQCGVSLKRKSNIADQSGDITTYIDSPDLSTSTVLDFEYIGDQEYIIASSKVERRFANESFAQQTTEVHRNNDNPSVLRSDSTIIVAATRSNPEVQIHCHSVISSKMNKPEQSIVLKVGKSREFFINPQSYPRYEDTQPDISIRRISDVLRLPNILLNRGVRSSNGSDPISYECLQSEEGIVFSIKVGGMRIEMLMPVPVNADITTSNVQVVMEMAFSGSIPLLFAPTIVRIERDGLN